MSLFGDLFGVRAASDTPSPPPPHDDFWYDLVGMGTLSGMRVSPEDALKLTVVFRCISIRAETLAALPFKLLERYRLEWQDPTAPPRGRRPALNHPLYPVLHDQPNRWMTAFEFWRLHLVHRLLWGNAWAEIVTGSFGLNELVPLNPNLCDWKESRGRAPYLRYTEPDGRPRAIPLHRVFRSSGLSLDGKVGLRVVSLLRETVGLAKAGEGYAARIFGSNGLQRAIFTTDDPLPPEKARQYHEEWQKRFGRGVFDAHDVAFLGNGLKPEKFGTNPVEAQLLESRKQQAIELCRMCGVPPHKAGIMDNTSGYKTEEENLRFIMETVQPDCVSIEQAVRRDMLSEEDRVTLYPKFNLSGLLRGNSDARSNYLVRMTQGGMFTPNEGRAYEDLDPLEGLDEPMSPLNMRQGALAPQPEEEGEDRGKGREKAVSPSPFAERGPGGEVQPAPAASSPAVLESERTRLLRPSTERLVRKEVLMLAKEAERCAKKGAADADWSRRVGTFYTKHETLIRATLPVSEPAAKQYCAEHAALLNVHGASALVEVEAEGTARLLGFLEVSP